MLHIYGNRGYGNPKLSCVLCWLPAGPGKPAQDGIKWEEGRKGQGGAKLVGGGMGVEWLQEGLNLVVMVYTQSTPPHFSTCASEIARASPRRQVVGWEAYRRERGFQIPFQSLFLSLSPPPPHPGEFLCSLQSLPDALLTLDTTVSPLSF